MKRWTARLLLLAIAGLVVSACDSRYTSDPAVEDAGGAADSGTIADAGAISDAGMPEAGAPVDAAQTSDAPTGDPDAGSCGSTCHVMFVTSGTFTSNLGGQAGADQKCQAAAAASKLAGISQRAARFIAWISTGMFDAAGMTARLPAVGTFARIDGKPIAGSVAELLSGTIQNNIVEDENGSAIMTGGLVGASWTGTRANGRTSADTCSDWTSLNGNGDIGKASDSMSTWTEGGAVACGQNKHLYCLEQ